MAGGGLTWWEVFLGNIQGSIGETSTLAIFIGGVVLLLLDESTDPPYNRRTANNP